MNGSAGRPLAGPAFPFRVVDGRVAMSSGRAKVADDVRHLLATRVGERLLRRTYGGGVHSRLQEPYDATIGPLVRHEIALALREHLPDLRLLGPVQVHRGADGGLRIVIEYRVPPQDASHRLALDLDAAAVVS